MKKKLILKLIESNDTPQLGDIVRERINCYDYTRILKEFHGNALVHKTAVVIKPILISDEEIKVGDKFLNERDIIESTEGITEEDLHIVNISPNCKKIEVTSEQIPINILEAIVEGKLKDGDSVEVEYECNDGSLSLHNTLIDYKGYSDIDIKYELKLDSNNKAICSIPEEFNILYNCKLECKVRTHCGVNSCDCKETTKEVSKIMYSEEEVIDLLTRRCRAFGTKREPFFQMLLKQDLEWFEQNKKK
jgi:hypothetical protein